VSVDAFKNEFNVSDRNYINYFHDLRAIPNLMDKNGESMVVEEKEGDVKFLRIRAQLKEEEKGDEFYASFFMASALMNFLAGTKLDDPIRQWIKTLESNGLKLHGSHLEKKFYSKSEMPKDYSGKGQIVRQILRAVTDQWKIDVTYNSRSEGKTSVFTNFKPYTLMQWRYGLYLVGEPEDKKKGLITLSLDRIADIKRNSAKFLYPSEYSPAKHFGGGMGLVKGGKTHQVELLFYAGVADLVRERTYHPSAKFVELKDGSIRVIFIDDSLTNVKSWVLSFGPNVTVEKPKELLDMVREEVLATAKIYGLIKGE